MQLFRNPSGIQSLLLATITVASNPLKHCYSSAFQPAAFTKNNHIFVLPGQHTRTLSIFSVLRGGGAAAIRPIFATGGQSAEGNSEKAQKESKEKYKGQTGWNHNLPKETSGFWTTLENDSSTQTGNESNTEEEGELRTGWLHKKVKKVATQKGGEDSSSKPTEGIALAQQMLREAKMKQKINHRIISPPTFHACGDGRRAVITEHFISVPVKYVNEKGEKIEDSNSIDVYFSIVDLVSTPEDESFFLSLQTRESSPTTKLANINEQQKLASAYKDFVAMKNANDCILYLQGGPGFGAPRPINGIGLSDKSSWLGAALGKGYKRVILMDQRGTGRSTAITKQTLEKSFPDLFLLDGVAPKILSDASSIDTVNKELESFEKTNPIETEKVKSTLCAAIEYLSQFRADNIVRDAEYIKDALLLSLDEEEAEKQTPRPWGASIGQSFGGFCTMTYLSIVPNPPKICLLTGGIAPMLTNIDENYANLRERVKQRNLIYFDRYPGDKALVKRIINRLSNESATLPSGGVLTARRFQQVGLGLGGGPSSFASLHSLFASAFLSEDEDELSRTFLKNVDSLQPYDDSPLYFLLHESIYVDSNSDCAKSGWSAMRAYSSVSDFDCSSSSLTDQGKPALLVGEVVFPWMVDGDYAELGGLSMRALAHSLAIKDDWGDLYNVAQMKRVLALDGTGVSKMAAAVYYGDMYVNFDACMEATKRGSPLENCKVWVTNDYQHSGLRDDGALIFNKLLGMAKGEIQTPS